MGPERWRGKTLRPFTLGWQLQRARETERARRIRAPEPRPAERQEWTATYAMTVEEFVAEAIRNGSPPPAAVVFRGAEAVALGGLLVVPWRGGVLAGPPDAVGQAIDREGG
jgi:hypothetical protein